MNRRDTAEYSFVSYKTATTQKDTMTNQITNAIEKVIAMETALRMAPLAPDTRMSIEFVMELVNAASLLAQFAEEIIKNVPQLKEDRANRAAIELSFQRNKSRSEPT